MKQGEDIGEKELAFLCGKGDSLAQKELYTRYATRLTALCSRYTQDGEEATDLMHDVMVKALAAIDKFQYVGKGSLYAWLSKLAVNLAIDRMRKNKRVELTSLDLIEDDYSRPAVEETIAVPLSVLKNMIGDLPDTKRLIFNLFCVDGLYHKEIAERLGITEKASSSMLSKAKRILSEKINDYYKNG